jgi:hypothetical protein
MIEVYTATTWDYFEKEILKPGLMLSRTLMDEERKRLSTHTPAQQAAAHVFATIMLCKMFNANPMEFFTHLFTHTKKAFDEFDPKAK